MATVVHDDTVGTYPLLVFHDGVDLWHSRDGRCGVNAGNRDLILEIVATSSGSAAIDRLREAAELFILAGQDKAAVDVLGLVIEYEGTK